MSSTPKGVVMIVVGTLACLSVIGVLSMSLTLFYKSYADPAVLTAFIAITSAAIGSLSSLLVNTRQPQESGTSVSTDQASTVTVEPQPPKEQKP